MIPDALVLKGGKIWTGDSFVKSVTIRGSRIESVAEPAPADARPIDLHGRLVVPGFMDNHLHFVMGSRRLQEVQLRDAATVQAFAQRISQHAAKIGRGQWITGGGWDEQQWKPPVLPTHETIDHLTPDNPVFVTRLDLHMGLASRIALQLAGITRETPDPPGGTIVRDAAGEPTGLLKDAAMQLLTRLLPAPTLEERKEAIRAGMRESARLGVTAVGDMGMSEEAFDDFRAFERLDRSGELTARFWMYLPITHWRQLSDAGLESGFGSARLRIGGVKGFSDGSLGSSTAAFYRHYEGEPGNRGLLMKPMENGSLADWIAGADADNLQPAIHAIGDRAVSEVLTLFEARPKHPERRFRIEHVQHIDAGSLRRFADGRFIASVQPYHAIDDGRWAVQKIGEDRLRWAFAYRSLLDAGVKVTFGSDWPVAPMNPLSGIYAAVTRRTTDGRHPNGWIPEQKITVGEALRCYTANNAWAVFAEKEIGTIAAGMRADLVVLSDDLFEIEPEKIEQVRVEMTIFDGQVIYEA